jgi:hypothetical protein
MNPPKETILVTQTKGEKVKRKSTPVQVKLDITVTVVEEATSLHVN